MSEISYRWPPMGTRSSEGERQLPMSFVTHFASSHIHLHVLWYLCTIARFSQVAPGYRNTTQSATKGDRGISRVLPPPSRSLRINLIKGNCRGESGGVGVSTLTSKSLVPSSWSGVGFHCPYLVNSIAVFDRDAFVARLPCLWRTKASTSDRPLVLVCGLLSLMSCVSLYFDSSAT